MSDLMRVMTREQIGSALECEIAGLEGRADAEEENGNRDSATNLRITVNWIRRALPFLSGVPQETTTPDKTLSAAETRRHVAWLAGVFTDATLLPQFWRKHALDTARNIVELLSSSSLPPSAATDPPPAPGRETPTEPGLNIDMLDADRLRQWAANLELHGPDITYWSSRAFVIKELNRIADGISAEVRDVGELRRLKEEAQHRLRQPGETLEHRLLSTATNMASNAIAGHSSVSTAGFIEVANLLREAQQRLLTLTDVLAACDLQQASDARLIRTMESRLQQLEAENADDQQRIIAFVRANQALRERERKSHEIIGRVDRYAHHAKLCASLMLKTTVCTCGLDDARAAIVEHRRQSPSATPEEPRS